MAFVIAFNNLVTLAVIAGAAYGLLSVAGGLGGVLRALGV